VEVTTEACTSNIVVAAPTPVSVPPSNMVWHLEQLLASKEGWDIKFLVEDSDIHAHSLVIATRSPALHELVESTTGTDHIRVDEMKAPIFKALLHFIYTDELPRIDDFLVVPSNATHSSMTVVEEMLA
jgi:speckle-type POZ protein